jgi:hypothetical protein
VPATIRSQIATTVAAERLEYCSAASRRRAVRGNAWSGPELSHRPPAIDYQATAMARTFVFYPALNDAGEPVAGTYVWTFVSIHRGVAPWKRRRAT